MAANDYSRRSKKDVFWGDDNNKDKSNELDELIKDEQRTLEEDTETNASDPVCEPVPEPLPEENFDEENFDEDFFPLFSNPTKSKNKNYKKHSPSMLNIVNL